MTIVRCRASRNGSEDLMVNPTADFGKNINVVDSLNIELVDGGIALKPDCDGGAKGWIRCRRREPRHGILRHRSGLTSELQRLNLRRTDLG